MSRPMKGAFSIRFLRINLIHKYLTTSPPLGFPARKRRKLSNMTDVVVGEHGGDGARRTMESNCVSLNKTKSSGRAPGLDTLTGAPSHTTCVSCHRLLVGFGPNTSPKCTDSTNGTNSTIICAMCVILKFFCGTNEPDTYRRAVHSCSSPTCVICSRKCTPSKFAQFPSFNPSLNGYTPVLTHDLAHTRPHAHHALSPCLRGSPLSPANTNSNSRLSNNVPFSTPPIDDTPHDPSSRSRRRKLDDIEEDNRSSPNQPIGCERTLCRSCAVENPISWVFYSSTRFISY